MGSIRIVSAILLTAFLAAMLSSHSFRTRQIYVESEAPELVEESTLGKGASTNLPETFLFSLHIGIGDSQDATCLGQAKSNHAASAPLGLLSARGPPSV